MNDKYRFDSNKLLWHMDRVHKHYRDEKPIAPIHIDIGVTKMCQLRCSYCYGLFQQMTGEYIPRKPLFNLFESAHDLNVKSITITGDGEPTLNPHIYEAVQIGHEHGLDIGFATNGAAPLSEERIFALLTSCTWVRFNLSAVTHTLYKSIHGIDMWDNVQDNIKRFRKMKTAIQSNCTLGLQMVLIPEVLCQVIPEAQFAIDNDVDYFVIKQFSSPGSSKMTNFSLDWYDKGWVRKILRRAQYMSTTTTKIIPKWKRIGSKGIRKYDHCVDCALIFQISGNSKCYPCGYLFNNDKYCYGDLKKQSLEEILKSQRYWDIIKMMRCEFDVHKDCVGCCRHDSTNEFIWNYMHPPTHLNFI